MGIKLGTRTSDTEIFRTNPVELTDRDKHCYVIGKTGSGKSTLLKSMAIQDILAGNGVCFLDPHGASVQKILDYIPPHRIDDVIYFNTADTLHPVTFNPLQKSTRADYPKTVASILQAFKSILYEGWGESRMTTMFLATLYTLLESEAPTLLGISRFLTDKDWQKWLLEHAEQKLSYQIYHYWQHHLSFNAREQAERSDPIISRVSQFVFDPRTQNILGKYHKKFDLLRVMNEQKILLVNLNKGDFGDLNAHLVGALLISELYTKANERPEGSEPFYLYLDEFQNFISGDIKNILAESRKRSLSLILAHQYIGQIPEHVRDAVFGNVATIVSFLVGARDAEELKDDLDQPVSVMTGELSEYEAVLKHDTTQTRFLARPIEIEPFGRAETIIERSREKYGTPSYQIENEIREFYSPIRPN